MSNQVLIKGAESVAGAADALSTAANTLAAQIAKHTVAASEQVPADSTEFWLLMTIFVLACFVGYYVVWSVTPALHSPLMAVTNAVSSVIIVGALIAAGPIAFSTSKVLGFIAVILASINIFGGFIVSQRMLAMFKKKAR